MTQIKKAMILAAGRGERLRPLTDTTPKPMLPVGGRPVLDYALTYLKSQGIEEVVINLWHLGEKIKQHVRQGHTYGLKVHYSTETVLLDSGGGLKNAQKYFEGEEVFCLMNGVILIDCSLQEVLKTHQQKKAASTLVLMERSSKDPHTPVGVRNGEVISFGGEGNYFYTGLSLFGPEIFSHLPEGKPCGLVQEGWNSMIQKQQTVAAHIHHGSWKKIFDKQSYQELQEEWASQHFNQRF